MIGRPPQETRAAESTEARRQRLAEELRANLLRRKSQARARRAASAEDGEKAKGEKA